MKNCNAQLMAFQDAVFNDLVIGVGQVVYEIWFARPFAGFSMALLEELRI